MLKDLHIEFAKDTDTTITMALASLVMPDGKLLGPHQLSVINKMLEPDGGIKGILVYHNMGLGKTLTAIAVARQLRSNKVYIAAPKTVQSHWMDQCTRNGLHNAKVVTHKAGLLNLATNPDLLGPGSLLIIDECHNMRTFIRRDNATQKIKAGSQARDMLLACQAAETVLLLSGTPVVNYTTDLLNIACALHGKDYDSGYPMFRKLFDDGGTRPPSLFRLSSLFRGRISVADGPVPDMPRRHEKVVRMIMDDEHYKFYKAIEDEQILLTPESGDPWLFMNAVRRAVNAGIEQADGAMQKRFYGAKIGFVERKVPHWLAKGAGEKVIIYTTWCEFGVNMLEAALRGKGIDCSIIDGSTSADERGQMVDDYNNNRMRVLLFTAAGAEGMDLKGTTRVLIVEPHWNPARTDQAVARAIRRGSHNHLSPEKQIVKVYRLLLEKPGESDEFPSVDLFMWDMTREKETWIESVFKPWAKHMSIEQCSNAPGPRPINAAAARAPPINAAARAPPINAAARAPKRAITPAAQKLQRELKRQRK